MGVQVPPPAYLTFLFLLPSLLFLCSACSQLPVARISEDPIRWERLSDKEWSATRNLKTARLLDAHRRTFLEYKRRVQSWRELDGDRTDIIDTPYGSIELSKDEGASFPLVSIVHRGETTKIHLSKIFPAEATVEAIRVSDSGERLVFISKTYGIPGIVVVDRNGEKIFEDIIEDLFDAQWGLRDSEIFFTTDAVDITVHRLIIPEGTKTPVKTYSGSNGYVLMKKTPGGVSFHHTSFDDLQTNRTEKKPRFLSTALKKSLQSIGFTETTLEVPSRDGTRIPLTLLEAKETDKRSILIEVYGAYGKSIPTGYTTERMLLLEKGYSILLAHVRGGGELGHAWHEAGRGKNKIRGVEDLAAAITFAKTSGLPVFVKSRSAGALLLLGALSSETVDGAILEAPFVSLDWWEKQPIRAREYPEWGEPSSNEYGHFKSIINDIHVPLFVWIGSEDSVTPLHAIRPWVDRQKNQVIVMVSDGAEHEGARTVEENDEIQAMEFLFTEALIARK